MRSGRVSIHSDIAAAIGRPRAVPAVGTAVGHYHWNLGVKRTMLAGVGARLEGAA